VVILLDLLVRGRSAAVMTSTNGMSEIDSPIARILRPIC
jgi:hypothetical protein